MHISWDYRVVLDLFLGGLGVGAFILASVLFFIDAKKYASIIKKSWIVAPFAIILGLLLLLTELGRPLNVIKAVVNINLTSVMSIGMFLQGICIAFMLLIVVKLLKSNVEDIPKNLLFPSLFFACLVGTYHGFLLLGIQNVAWSDIIPMMFIISSILTALSFIVLLYIKEDGFDELCKDFKLPAFFTSLITLQAITLLSWVYSLSISSAKSQKVYFALMNNFSSEFFIFLIIGLILPLITILSMALKKVQSKNLYALTATSVIIGSLILKYVVVYLGQMV